MATRRTSSSKLFSRKWIVPDLGAFTVNRASNTDAREADSRWALGRAPDDTNLHWQWASILPHFPERFALRDSKGALAGLWSSKGKIVVAEDGPLYRVDYLEIDPSLRSVGRTRVTFGFFALALAACRARERDCIGLAIPSLEETAKIFARMGAIRGVKGWNLSPPLAPYRMIDQPFRRLLELADEYEDKT